MPFCGVCEILILGIMNQGIGGEDWQLFRLTKCSRYRFMLSGVQGMSSILSLLKHEVFNRLGSQCQHSLAAELLD